VYGFEQSSLEPLIHGKLLLEDMGRSGRTGDVINGLNLEQVCFGVC
jgi:hypothetical protein